MSLSATNQEGEHIILEVAIQNAIKCILLATNDEYFVVGAYICVWLV